MSYTASKEILQNRRHHISCYFMSKMHDWKIPIKNMKTCQMQKSEQLSKKWDKVLLMSANWYYSQVPSITHEQPPTLPPPRTWKPSSPLTSGSIVVLFVVKISFIVQRFPPVLCIYFNPSQSCWSWQEKGRKTYSIKTSLLLFRMQMSPSAMRKLVFYGEAFI